MRVPPYQTGCLALPGVRVPAQVVFRQCLVKRVLLTIAYFSDIEGSHQSTIAPDAGRENWLAVCPSWPISRDCGASR